MKSLNELTKVDQSLATNKAFIARLRSIQDAQAAIDAEWDSLKAAMLKSNVGELSGEWGKIAFEPAIYYRPTNKKEIDKIDEAFTKLSLDTDKVRDYVGLFNELPIGVSTSTIKKFVRRIR